MVKIRRQEIADYLGVSAGYVGILLHRHKIKLKNKDAGRLLDLIMWYKMGIKGTQTLKETDRTKRLKKYSNMMQKRVDDVLKLQWMNLDNSAKKLDTERHYVYITRRDELRTRGMKPEAAIQIMTGYLERLIEGWEGGVRNYYRKKAKFN